MAANSLLASAAHALCLIAWRGDAGTNSEELARSLNTNAVVVRRILKALEQEGLVKLRPGRNGGVELLRPPAEITLEDIHRAIEPDGASFVLRDRRNPRCIVSKAMMRTLPAVFQDADDAVDAVLRRTTLASLVETIRDHA